MTTIIKSLITRMLQPASVPGYIAGIIAAMGYDPSTPLMQQLTVIGCGAAGALLVLLNTKFKLDK